jgi:PleD family two-component response regulator
MMSGRDEAGRLGRGVDRLISDMQETQRLSITDPLTGLGNVRHLTDALRLEIERASRFSRALGVLALDVGPLQVDQ